MAFQKSTRRQCGWCKVKTVKNKTYNGKIPSTVFNAFAMEATGLSHGIMTLTLHIRNGNLSRYVINREISVVPDRLLTGSME